MGNNAFGKGLATLKHASPIGQDRLIRKEISLGMIREQEPPQNHIGLTLAPFKDVPTDDVIFDYVKGMTSSLAPARAEDAEAELALADEMAHGQGRASVIDWSLKNTYSASDVKNFRDLRDMYLQMQENASLPLTVQSALSDWGTKLARDTARRKVALDNRIELMILSAIHSGGIAYNDGKIKFTVDFGRPNAQKASHADNNLAQYVTAGKIDWSGVTHDPIGFFKAVQEWFFEKYGVRLTRVLTSRKVLNAIFNSEKWSQRAGLGFAVTSTGDGVAPDLNYLVNGWGRDAAILAVEQATEIKFIEYDSVYRTRALGSQTVVNNRFMPQDRMVFLPDEADLTDVDDTEIGFGKTLTSPHAEGEWTTGFYEWEKENRDPWTHDAGTGIKAFPVFPFMEYTYAVDVVLPA